jgi:hypothetical protein
MPPTSRGPFRQAPPVTGSFASCIPAAALYALVAGLLVLPGLLPGRILAPLDLTRDVDAWKPDPRLRYAVSNSLLSDPVLQTNPWEVEVRRALTAGRFPWRNGYSGEGVVLFNNPAAALLSPFTWVRLALGDPGWALSVLLKLLVAALGMRYLVLVLGGRRPAALFSGFVYLLSGYSLLWALHPQTNVHAFLPWLAASAHALIAAPSRRGVLALIAASALATAGGHPETLAFGVLAIALFLALEWKTHQLAGNARSAALATAAAAGGFCLLGIQLVPFLGSLPQSRVTSLRTAWTGGGLQFFALAGQVVPGFLGSPLRREIDLSGAFPGSGSLNARSGGFIGLLALTCIVLSAPRLAPRFRNCVWISVAAAAIVFAVPPVGWLWSRLPVVRLFAKEYAAAALVLFAAAATGPALEGIDFGRRATRVAGVALLCGGVLLAGAGLAPSFAAARPAIRSRAADGVEALKQRGHLRQAPEVYAARLDGYLERGRTTALRRLALPGAFWILGASALLWFRRRSLLALAALGELFAFGWGFLPAVSRSDAPGAPPAIEAIRARNPGARSMIAAAGGVYPIDLATVDGLRDGRAYEYLESSSWAERLIPCGYDEIARAFPEDLSSDQVECLGRIGVHYVLSRAAPPGTVPIGGGQPPAVRAYWIPAASDAPPPLSGPPPHTLLGALVSLFGAALGIGAAQAARGLRPASALPG